MTIRLVAIDDHPMARAGVRSEPKHSGTDLVTVGEAVDVEDAAAACYELEPDVALLDVHPPGGRGGGGTEVSARCQNAGGLCLLVLFVSDSPGDVVQVIRSGTRSYATKSVSTPELVEAIRRAASGDATFSPRLAGFILNVSGTGQVATGDNELDPLSVRRQEVMRLITRGYTYKEAGNELFVSIEIVEAHMSAVLCKLQLPNRNELTRWVIQRYIVRR